MKTGRYLKRLLKDFFMACGVLMIMFTIGLGIYSTQIVKFSIIGQVILLSSAYAFLKMAFVSKDELGEKVQKIFFFVSLSLSEIMLMLWLCFFSPGKIMNTDLMIIYILSIIIVKSLVYRMININGEKHAKLINEKLIEYKNGEK